ncbi:MAG: hypothetical protein P1P82_10325 [Bacteroidales bacterium]|nr:hypothetical protein [Bacteroidales bacterium]
MTIPRKYKLYPYYSKPLNPYICFKIKIMLTRQTVQKSIEQLPPQFSIDELIEKLIFIEKVEEGRKQSREGNLVSNEDVREIISKWSR